MSRSILNPPESEPAPSVARRLPDLLSRRTIALIGGALGVVVLAGLGLAAWLNRSQDLTTPEIAALLTPSTVMIRTEQVPIATIVFDPSDKTYQLGEEKFIGSGTGIFLEEGYILTNAHVVEGASEVRVSAPGAAGEGVLATFVGFSPCEDLALYKTDNATELSDLRAARLGTTNNLQLGQDVIALGYPLGEQVGIKPSVTQGIISQLDALFPGFPMRNLIQTDAAINHGNSGGPLVNRRGEVIGINTLGYNDSQNINYAIGINKAQEVMAALKESRYQGWLGLSLREMPVTRTEIEDLAGFYGNALFDAHPIDVQTQSYLFVQAVQDGSPAKNIGIKPGDLLVTLKDRVYSTSDVCEKIKSAGEQAPMSVEVRRRVGNELQFLSGQIVVSSSDNEAGQPLSEDESKTFVLEGNASSQLPVSSEAASAAASTTASTTAEPAQTPTEMPAESTPEASVIQTYELSGADLEQVRNDYDQRLGQYQQIYQETFDSATTKQRWSEFDENDVRRTRLVNGYYELQIKSNNYIIPDHWDQQALGENYLVQLDVAIQTQGSYAGILFDYQDDQNYSAFTIGSDNSWNLVTFQADEFVQSRSGEYPSTAVIGGGKTNQLRVLRTPDTIQFWVNHTLVGEMPSGPSKGGYIGLAGVSGDQVPSTLIMDNLYVRTR